MKSDNEKEERSTRKLVEFCDALMGHRPKINFITCEPCDHSKSYIKNNTLIGYESLKHDPTVSINPGEPYGHPGCKNHITHPCEGCRRTGCR